MTKSERLGGRVALVTGASRGLGAAVAKRLAAEGAHVVALARTQGGLAETDDAIQAAGGKPATLVQLDLKEPDAIDQMGAALYQRFGKLDILVGNAGVLGSLSPTGHYTKDVWAEVMATNLTANWRLIRCFDQLLRRSDAGRAVFVTCAQGRTHTPYWGAYAASKAALETLVNTYAAEVAEVSSLRVSLVDPGTMRTRLRAQAFPGEDPLKHPEPDERAGMVMDLAVA
ncbi:MAG TPA: SDR family NAD(P)-dependent oxidoreductase [Magnetospirillaceae bacterium]|jgi:NAD(P)-dependent dehydrogenase (short-subunit alcohol dehydrogenase family)